MLCAKQGGFAVERINEDAPESSSRKRKKMAAAHVPECNRGKSTWHLPEGPSESCYKWYLGSV